MDIAINKPAEESLKIKTKRPCGRPGTNHKQGTDRRYKMFRVLIEEKWEDVINACKAAESEAMRSPLNGWNVDVLIDNDGNVWTEGPRTEGTQTPQEWEGDALCIYSAQCGQFDLDYMIDCVCWPDSMISFVEDHRIPDGTEDIEDIASCDFWIDGEHMYFDACLPGEVELDFIEEYVNELDIESKILVE